MVFCSEKMLRLPFSKDGNILQSIFFLICCFALPICLFAAPTPNDSAFRKVTLSKNQLSSLRKELQRQEVDYDREAHMLSQAFGTPGYHTTLKKGPVHATLNSLGYALNLLDANIDSLSQRAALVIDTVLSLQDKNPMSKTFGIWPWFLEESLKNMSPPDFNWADFCGKRLLEIIINHRAKLPEGLAIKIDSAIVFAAREIQQRNVGPNYTNIAVMGTFVTIVAGDYYQIPVLYNYGIQRLQRFYNYTLQQGGFTEYNSPTYNTVVVEELNRMRFYVNNKEASQLISVLYARIWREIALHFHVPTQQWAGPHSRCYSSLLQPSTLSMIKNALAKAEDKIFSLDDFRYTNTIPDSLNYYFTNAKQTRVVVDTFKKNQPAFIGTTYITPEYAIGSINQCDMWNQRRDLIVYWGDAPKTSLMQVRLLHDFYDFSSGVFRSVQQGNKILAAIGFITDGGDTHPSLDKVKNATIKAKDIRLRFEFNGYGLQEFKLKKLGEFSDYTHVQLNGMDISLIVPFAVFGDNVITWEYGTSKNTAWVDVVFYKGTTADINLEKVEKAAAVIALSIAKKADSNFPELTMKNIGSNLDISWGSMQLLSPLKPYKSTK